MKLMAPITTVRGVDVFSDKRLLAIAGSTVVFTDGDWVNVDTGDVSVEHHGFITLGQPPSGTYKHQVEPRVVMEPQRFKAGILSLSRIRAHIRIDTHDMDDVCVEASGPKDVLDDLTIRSTDEKGFLQVMGTSVPQVESEPRVGRLEGDGSSIWIQNRELPVQSFDDGLRIGQQTNLFNGPLSMHLRIAVPFKMPIMLTNLSGVIVAGNTGGVLNVIDCVEADIHVGRVADVEVSAGRRTRVFVQEVTDRIVSRVQSGGHVHIVSGVVASVRARVCGDGAFLFFGRTKVAELSASDAGRIAIDHVVEPPKWSWRPNGQIDIAKIG